MDETRARFLAAIAKQLPAERIAEVHLFAAIRQGGAESGVAVIALEPEHVPNESSEQSFAPADSPYASQDDAETATVAAPALPRRYVVCTARYRHTLKGPDRGKWEVTVTEVADAPLLTVDAVVRGVQRRSGDLDEIVRLTGDEVRAALPVPTTP
jgi:hypothetical protein